jgi:hypothetical protein
MSDVTDIDRLLETRPTDEETARAAVAPWRSLDARARIEALTSLLRDMDTLLDGRMPVRSPDDENFWRHWMDASLGRSR